ncbi:hypothetical protein ACJRO7_022179 [Eucalyptus globulus]|uniref:Uncharacterized protein n=1 Tax=Eucalyptus globulus TaxID=34317 RepID=A0ABD3KNR4_EUCGL
MSEDGKAEEAKAARRPWNLRPRRAVNPPPLLLRNDEAFHDTAGEDKENYIAQQQQLQPQLKSVWLRDFVGEGKRKEKKRILYALPLFDRQPTNHRTGPARGLRDLAPSLFPTGEPPHGTGQRTATSLSLSLSALPLSDR